MTTHNEDPHRITAGVGGLLIGTNASGVGPTPCRNLDGGQWGGVLGAIGLGCPPLDAAGGEVRGKDEGHRIRW